MPRFLFFRHAQSINNVLHKRLKLEISSDMGIRPLEARERGPDPELSLMGIQQAMALADNMHRFCEGKTLVVSSPFRRTLDTLAASLEFLQQRPSTDIMCHGQIYEIGGCFHMNKSYAGFGKKEIEKYCTEMIDIDEAGWFSQRKTRESYTELQKRIEKVYDWCVQLRDEAKYDTIILFTHGAFQARLIRRIIQMSEDVWICHANTGYTSLLWDKEKGCLLEGINKTDHIPEELRTGDSVLDGWWPAISQRGYSVLAVPNVPSKHQYLHEEITSIRGVGKNDEESTFFCVFQKDELCGFVEYNSSYGNISSYYENIENDIAKNQLYLFMQKSGVVVRT